jgi:3-phenylpropionate/trans-cinnamate dioxygenase ferredoxin subunit
MSSWIRACSVDDVEVEDVIPVELEGCSVAIYRSPDGEFYATDGHCTHARTLLGDGFVMGHIIECPKHNGRFDYRTGEGKGAPITVNLTTHPVKVEGDAVYVDLG